MSIKKMFGKMKSDVFLDMIHDIGFNKRPKTMNKKHKKSCGFELQPSLYRPIIIQWSEKNCGFGEMVFYRDGDKIFCNNECMSKDFLKMVLCHLVDKAILTEPPKRVRKKKMGV